MTTKDKRDYVLGIRNKTLMEEFLQKITSFNNVEKLNFLYSGKWTYSQDDNGFIIGKEAHKGILFWELAYKLTKDWEAKNDSSGEI